MKTKAQVEIHVTQADNDHFFDQKLPTWRNGYCKIKRTVTFCTDPLDVYPDGEYGTILVGGRRLIVFGSPSQGGMEIQGWDSAVR